MSYCRIGELGSAVYVIRHVDGTLVCYCDFGYSKVATEQEMIVHLRSHLSLGQHVPPRVFERLEAERDNKPYKTDVEIALQEFTGRYQPSEDTGEQD